MKVNKNSITIIVERFIDALEATIEFEEKKRGKERKKKKKVEKISKGATFQTPFKLFTSKFYRETYAQTFPRLSKFSSLLHVYPFLSSFPSILQHQTIGIFTIFRDINFLTWFSLSLLNTIGNTLSRDKFQ